MEDKNAIPNMLKVLFINDVTSQGTSMIHVNEIRQERGDEKV